MCYGVTFQSNILLFHSIFPEIFSNFWCQFTLKNFQEKSSKNSYAFFKCIPYMHSNFHTSILDFFFVIFVRDFHASVFGM